MQAFIKQNFSKELKKYAFHLTKEHRVVISEIYRFLLSAEKSWSKQSHRIEDSGFVETPFCKKEKGFDWIPSEIQDLLSRSIFCKKEYQCRLGQRMINIEMMYPVPIGTVLSKSDKNRIHRFFEDTLYRIYLWLFIAEKYASPRCSSEINIHIYFTDHLKKLPQKKGLPFQEIHANTAFTTICAPSTNVHIFRKEEWFKVFIHETFHNLGLDFSTMDVSELDQNMNRAFPLKKDLGIFETYCEIWAVIMTSLFEAYFSTNGPKEAVLVKMEKILLQQAIYSVFQAAKVLDHHGLTYQDVLSKSLSGYKETTYVFSYYVLKSILLFGLEDFLDFCIRHNKNTIDFDKNGKTVLKYGELIVLLSKNEDFQEVITKAENVLHNAPMDNEIRNTMRMTQGTYGRQKSSGFPDPNPSLLGF
jgi:hypothetical protein